MPVHHHYAVKRLLLQIDSDAFKLIPDEQQVRAAKRIIKRREGRRAAKSFRGTPVFAAQNFHIVVPTPEGVRWYVHSCRLVCLLLCKLLPFASYRTLLEPVLAGIPDVGAFILWSLLPQTLALEIS